MFLAAYEKILDNLRLGAEKALGDDLENEDIARSVSFCDMRFGDIATNVALQQAKEAGRNPRDLAEAIVSELQKLDTFASAEVAGPGFVNIRLHEADYIQLLHELKPGFFRTERERDDG